MCVCVLSLNRFRFLCLGFKVTFRHALQHTSLMHFHFFINMQSALIRLRSGVLYHILYKLIFQRVSHVSP